MEEICGDLAAEGDDLDALVTGAGPAALDQPTPAPGWAVRDQLSHLWFFDQRAALALIDPDAFRADAEKMLAAHRAGADPSVEAGRRLTADELLQHWRADRARLLEIARTVDPSTRVPWYGPDMGARSFATARLMETWAHGQDIVDGLALERAPTDRLRHIAHIGVRARPFSYAANRREMPEAEIRVELRPRSTAQPTWTWGPEDADDIVRGDALDFCLVVTQRRHPDDVALDVTGEAANDWISIAQAFAGPPGAGRVPGQFARR